MPTAPTGAMVVGVPCKMSFKKNSQCTSHVSVAYFPPWRPSIDYEYPKGAGDIYCVLHAKMGGGLDNM